MSDDPHSRGGPPTHVADGARTPSPAERARTLVAGQTSGSLSTIALDPVGYPFGSVVTFALDGVGTPLVSMSSMAEHARNLAADPRASLLVTAGGDGAGRLAAARATLVGTLATVEGDDAQAAALEAYLAVHPEAFWARFPDFTVHRLEVEAIRYVRGFGEMGWVDPAAYATAEPDPVAPAEARIVEHMNDDHADALRGYVDALLPVDGEVTDVVMTSCDRYGFEVRIDLAPPAPGERPGLAFGRIGFDRVLDDAAEARDAMVALSRAVGL
ncbi:MAG: HugZ family protein [Actinomycetes bacterium]